jgi:hypothetical protein
MSPFSRFVCLFPPSLQWVPWPPLAGALRFPTFTGTMGSYDHSASIHAAYGSPRLRVPSTLRRLSSR